jgi:type IV pilus assembly protein PilF
MAAIKDPFYTTPAIALANAGSCALERGDMDKAETYLRQSLEYDNQLGSSLLPMAQISYAQGNYLRARAFLQRYQALGVMNEESLYLGYQIEKALGDEKSADKYRLELRNRYPDSIQAGRTASQE